MLNNTKGPITCGSFNNTGNIFAYALSYDWGQGHQGNTGQLPTKIMLHACKVGQSILRLRMWLNLSVGGRYCKEEEEGKAYAEQCSCPADGYRQ